MAIEKEPRITFTLGQQVMVDRLMDGALAKGLMKGVRDSRLEIERLKNEIARLKLPFWRR